MVADKGNQHLAVLRRSTHSQPHTVITMLNWHSPVNCSRVSKV